MYFTTKSNNRNNTDKKMEDIFIFLFLLYSGLDLTFVTRILKELSVNENQEYDSYESLQI